MPYIFLKNVPPGIQFDLTGQLHTRLKTINYGMHGNFQIIIENSAYELLMPDGSHQKEPNLHVVVLPHKLPEGVRSKITDLLHRFLTTHAIEANSIILFRTYDAHKFFVNGEMVVGRPPRRS